LPGLLAGLDCTGPVFTDFIFFFLLI